MKTLAALGLALILALAGNAQAIGPNLLANPGFETGDYSGWFTFGSGPNITMVGDADDIVRNGTWASKIFGEFAGCPFGSFTVGGYGQAFATPTPGTWYEFTGYSYVSSADTLQGTTPCDGARAVAKLVYFDAASSGNEIGAVEIPIGEPGSILDEWQRFSILAPVPAGALRVEALILFLQPVCEEGAVFVDDLELFEKTPATTPNLLANGDFSAVIADSIVNWATFGNALHEPTANLALSSPGVAKMFGTFTEGSPSVLTQSVASVTGGTTYELSAYVNNLCSDAIQGDAAQNFLLARVEFYNALGDTTSAEAVFYDASQLPGAWPQKTLETVAPGDAVSAAVFFLFIQPDPVEGGSLYIDDAVFRVAGPTNAPTPPRGFSLKQNLPNPFNPSTVIDFTIDREGPVQVDVFNAAGRKVATLLDRDMPAGQHSVRWNGLSSSGGAVASGVYHYVLRTGDGWTSRSMVLLK